MNSTPDGRTEEGEKNDEQIGNARHKTDVFESNKFLGFFFPSVLLGLQIDQSKWKEICAEMVSDRKQTDYVWLKSSFPNMRVLIRFTNTNGLEPWGEAETEQIQNIASSYQPSLTQVLTPLWIMNDSAEVNRHCDPFAPCMTLGRKSACVSVCLWDSPLNGFCRRKTDSYRDSGLAWSKEGVKRGGGVERRPTGKRAVDGGLVNWPYLRLPKSCLPWTRRKRQNNRRRRFSCWWSPSDPHS